MAAQSRTEFIFLRKSAQYVFESRKIADNFFLEAATHIKNFAQAKLQQFFIFEIFLGRAKLVIFLWLRKCAEIFLSCKILFDKNFYGCAQSHELYFWIAQKLLG